MVVVEVLVVVGGLLTVVVLVVVGARLVVVVLLAVLVVVELVPVDELGGLTHATGTAHLFATNLPDSSRDGALQVEQYRSDPTVRMTPRVPCAGSSSVIPVALATTWIDDPLLMTANLTLEIPAGAAGFTNL